MTGFEALAAAGTGGFPEALGPTGALDAVAAPVVVTETRLAAPGPRILYVNPAFERLTGWPRAEIVGRTPRVLQGPDTDRTIFGDMHAELAAGRSWQAETVNYRRDGTPFLTCWTIQPMHDGAGRPRAYLATLHDMTARRGAEDLRDRLQTKVDRLMELSCEAIVLVDADRRILHVSRGGERIFGWPAEHLIGAPVEELLPERLRRRHVDHVRAFAASGEVSRSMRERGDLSALHRDGHEVPIDAAIARIETERETGFAVIVRDLSREHARERALQESERRFRAIFEQSFQSVAVLAPDGTVQEVNRGALAFAGVGIEQARGQPFADTPWWRDLPTSRARLQEALEAAARGTFVHFQASSHGRGGQLRTLDLSVKPVLDDAGAVTLLVAEGRDITDMITRREALKREAARMRTAQRIGRMGGWDYDAHTYELHVHPETLQLLQLAEAGERVGRAAFARLIHPEDRARVRRTFHDALAADRKYSCEYRVWAGEAYRMIHAVGEPFHGRDGAVTGMVGIVQDVTEEHAAREELVAARNAAQAASEAKTRFLAVMSHELRTPLNAVNGFSALIEQEALGPVGTPIYADYARHIRESGEHLLDVINRILDVARVESGGTALEESAFSGSALVASTADMLTGAGLPRDIRLALGTNPDVTLYADRQVIRQALLNLAGNAVKFSPPGATVAIAATLSGDGSYAVAVRDAGPGIPEAALAHVKTAFYQADQRLQRTHEGSGLGLYLANAFLELHGGRLELASTPGQGTTARAILPPERVWPP